ncbi:hypothetical protein OESDEN_17091 [Oesophagostomum dentatum]|uniref:Uncharacterized protein n=1 Tax=Oesophagostomum dentatum TaxID=61180 RepID=A0A0B1SI77_OESDE|nr:hypothetical protein OESDEN_17091 [Oesophagostomum dentatum]
MQEVQASRVILVAMETMDHLDLKDLLDHLDHLETLDETDLGENQDDLPSVLPLFREIQERRVSQDHQDFQATLARAAAQAQTDSQDHKDLQDHPDLKDLLERSDPLDSPDNLDPKENEVSARNIALWTAVFSSRMVQEDNGYSASGVRNPRLLRAALQMSRFVFALVPVSELRSRFHNRLGFEPQLLH